MAAMLRDSVVADFSFGNQAMPFSRPLEKFLAIKEFFCTKLKKIENFYVNTQYRTRNL